jgi:hypothetical protein
MKVLLLATLLFSSGNLFLMSSDAQAYVMSNGSCFGEGGQMVPIGFCGKKSKEVKPQGVQKINPALKVNNAGQTSTVPPKH